MSYPGSDSTYHEVWTQQAHGHGNDAYTQGDSGYHGGSRQAHPQPGTDTSYYQHQYGGSGSLHHPYSEQVAPRAAYMQSASNSSGAYSVHTATTGFAGGYQTEAYASTMARYSQHSPPWPQMQQSPVAPGSQGMVQPRFVTSPVEYAGAQVPPVAPRMTARADTSYMSSHTWPGSVSSTSGSSSGHATAVGRPTGSGAECVVPCPYNCGTVLTGAHAVGNMTRHLKSQNCIGSGRDKPKHVCPVQDCDKRYIRSDGLKVHLRKRHNISQMPGRNGDSEYDESGYEYT